MPPRRLLLATLALVAALTALLAVPRQARPSGWGGEAAVRPAPAAPHRTWRWPVHARVTGAFRLTPRIPFAAGQRRGLDLVAAPGATVRAACPGRVSFAGPLPHAGLALTIHCGPLAATYLRLATLTAHRGDQVKRGARLGTVGPSGRLRLGARRATDRRAYLDPLSLLADARTTAPPTAPPPGRAARRGPPTRPAPAPPPHPTPRPRPLPPPRLAQPARQLPWLAYPALALIAAAIPLGGLVHRRRRRAAPVPVAAHEGP